MKRFLITFALFLTVFSMSSFANEEKFMAPSAVVTAFQASFSKATEVSWTTAQDFYKASFALNGQYVSAFYNAAGDLIALTRNISSTQLPVTLQAGLKQSYDSYWISDLFEVASEEGTTYYVTMENADTRLVLKSGTASWSTYQKQSKS